MKDKIGNKSQLGICLHNINVGHKEKKVRLGRLKPQAITNVGPT